MTELNKRWVIECSLPYKFEYRKYQVPLVNFIRKGGKRWVVIWHRRAGKDKTFFNILVEMAAKKKGWYAYILPTYTQGKKIVWDSIDNDGNRFFDHIPDALFDKANVQTLKIDFTNGSFIQILGSDNADGLRWAQWAWVVFSEYAYQNPTAWDVIRPILAQSGWFALFNSTPNWKNHFYDLAMMAEKNENWFFQKLTVEDTWVVSMDYIEEERRTWMTEEMIQQEYFCSFDVWAIWSYYADLMTKASDEWRICKLPKNFSPVDIYFDLWRNDSTSLWFKQNDDKFYNFIHYFENAGEHISFYFNYVRDYLKRHNLGLGSVYFPHDSSQVRIDTEKTSLQQAQDFFGSHNVVYLTRTNSTQKDIDKVREMLPKCYFDIDECKVGIRCLENYKKERDDKNKVFKNEPLHDWASHGADAFRYFAVSERWDRKRKLRISTPNI